MKTDLTHDVALRCSIESANGHPEFPIQNLPLGIFSPTGGGPRGGVAIGEDILDLAALADAGLLAGEAAVAAHAAGGRTLNALFALPPAARAALRWQISRLLVHDAPQRAALHAGRGRWLHAARDCTLHLPSAIGNFTDCMASLHHVARAGRQVRPDSPIFPNLYYLPAGYHSRASSVRESGVPVVRPRGQVLAAGATVPEYAPSQALDFETEVGLWIGGENRLGDTVPIARAAERIAGICLLNDWSARDIQRWETQPLGPFLGKSFQSTVSPWVVTVEALAPYRVPLNPRPLAEPQPLPHLLDALDQQQGAWLLEVETLLLTPAMAREGRAPERLTRATFRDFYWTPAQLIAHHTSNGCNLLPGDLIGTGTLSGREESEAGCLLELTLRGQRPLSLSNGEQRGWLQDGDELIIRGHCAREGFARIGLGECRAQLLPAREMATVAAEERIDG